MQLDVDLGFEGMKEEIGNLEKCGAGKVIGQAEVDALKKKHPLMRVIPSRWVSAYKNESRVRVRIVANDLNRGISARKLGISSPTPSIEGLHFVLTLADKICEHDVPHHLTVPTESTEPHPDACATCNCGHHVKSPRQDPHMCQHKRFQMHATLRSKLFFTPRPQRAKKQHHWEVLVLWITGLYIPCGFTWCVHESYSSLSVSAMTESNIAKHSQSSFLV